MDNMKPMQMKLGKKVLLRVMEERKVSNADEGAWRSLC